MGLFSRKNPYEKDVLDLEASFQAAQVTPPRPAAPPQSMPPLSAVPQAPTPVPPPAAARPASNYGIEDAIKLMRELPDNKKEMVISIVQKTLISAKINVATIIDDAGRKIDRLERKNEKLGQEIRELEEAIMQRKLEMDHNARDIAETRDVKTSFESTARSHMDESTTVSAPRMHLEETPFHHTPYIPSQKAG
jgi:vacuolar-type H+-ATPase subunit I/STV1